MYHCSTLVYFLCSHSDFSVVTYSEFVVSQVSDSAFASCLARHNSYVREATSHYDASYSTWIHDLKHLLLKFANEKSFSTESGGGGPQSNMYFAPYLLHVALYVLNT